MSRLLDAAQAVLLAWDAEPSPLWGNLGARMDALRAAAKKAESEACELARWKALSEASEYCQMRAEVARQESDFGLARELLETARGILALGAALGEAAAPDPDAYARGFAAGCEKAGKLLDTGEAATNIVDYVKPATLRRLGDAVRALAPDAPGSAAPGQENETP